MLSAAEGELTAAGVLKSMGSTASDYASVLARNAVELNAGKGKAMTKEVLGVLSRGLPIEMCTKLFDCSKCKSPHRRPRLDSCVCPQLLSRKPGCTWRRASLPTV